VAFSHSSRGVVEACVRLRSRSADGPFPLRLRRLHGPSTKRGDVRVADEQTGETLVHRRRNSSTLFRCRRYYYDITHRSLTLYSVKAVMVPHRTI